MGRKVTFQRYSELATETRVWASSLWRSPRGQKSSSRWRPGLIKLLLLSRILVGSPIDLTKCSISRPEHWKLGSPLHSYQVLILSAVTSCSGISAKQTFAHFFAVQRILFIKCKMDLRSRVCWSTVSVFYIAGLRFSWEQQYQSQGSMKSQASTGR